MPQKYSFKTIKDYLKGLPALKFDGVDKEDVGKLSSFLEDFFDYNASNCTIYVNNGEKQCGKNKRRSIGDIYRITAYYFPKVALTTIYRSLLKQIAGKQALSAICSATHMRVYRKTDGYESNYFNGQPIDEFMVDISKFEELSGCPRERGSWGIGAGISELKIVNIPVKETAK